jgi:hypothetical protein
VTKVRDELRQRHAAGETLTELAQKTGIPRATVRYIAGAGTYGRRKPKPGLAELTLF